MIHKSFIQFVKSSSVDNIKLLKEKYNIDFFMAVDENMTSNLKWTKEFCNLYVKEGLDNIVKWGTLGDAPSVAVKPEIIEKYDHSLVLNGETSHAEIDLTAFEKVFLLPYQPTSENLVTDFALKIKSKLPKGIKLYKVVLSETATSFAEWHSKDQKLV